MVIFLVYPNPSPQKRVFLRYLSCIATQGRRGKYNPIQFAKLMWQKIELSLLSTAPLYID